MISQLLFIVSMADLLARRRRLFTLHSSLYPSSSLDKPTKNLYYNFRNYY